ncbi:uncharacterized protein LOC119370754 [Jatropha curcas]|uniref:uncharacterized protein LOC119370754 n=1 Tax=Jatropha curcas TaxID=180498 RepID=UPI0018952F9F|nr:uncharacterized protein LOC119370754 [Jatropha curcas]
MRGSLLGSVGWGPNRIEIDPDKIKAIQDMEPPRTERQLLRKNQPVRWNKDCQKAFNHIKKYLMNPPVLSCPKPGEPLILYLSVEDAGVGAMLAQPDAARVEKAIYYISKKLLPIEEKYNLIEKTCMAVGRHDAELSIKEDGQSRVCLAEFLAENPIVDDDDEPWELEFPEEHLLCVEKGVWKLYFDGSANRNGAGASIVIEAPNGEVTIMCKRLLFPVTNNMAEYEACIMGIESFLATGAKEVEVIGDSLLVIEHASERWKVEEDRLK